MLTSQSIGDVWAAHAVAHSEEYFYMLADHAGIPGLHRRLTHTNINWVSLFDGTTQANALAVAPLLIRIEPNSQGLRDNAFLTWVCERGTYSSCLMLIASRLALAELAVRLTARLDAKISEDMDVLLRFFDPRVFEQLVRRLSIEQRSDFLGAGSCWWYVDRRGELQAVQSQFSDQELFQSPLVLSARQEHELVDASEVDQVEAQLRLSLPNEFSGLDPCERYNFIAAHMAAGRGFQITATRELTLYCALALLYGGDFSTRPEWSSAFDLIRNGKQDLTTLVASLNETLKA